MSYIIILYRDVVTGNFLPFGKNTNNKELLPLVAVTQSNSQGTAAVTSGLMEKGSSRDVYVRMTIGTQTKKLDKDNRNSNEGNGLLFRQLYAALKYAATSELGDVISSSSSTASTTHIKYRQKNKRFQRPSPG